MTCMTNRVRCLAPVKAPHATVMRTGACLQRAFWAHWAMWADVAAARNAGPSRGVLQSQPLDMDGGLSHCVPAHLSMQVLQYSGPLAENPGQFLRVAAQWTPPSHDSTNAENYFPHDVKWHKGINGIGAPGEPLLLVVRQHGQERSRLAIFSAVSGRLLKELGFPHEENSLVSHMFSMKYILVD